MSKFVTNFIEEGGIRYNANFKELHRNNLLKSIKDSNAYIGGEYIMYILNYHKYKNNFMNPLEKTFNIYVKYSNLLSFIIKLIKDYKNLNLFFENIITDTFLYIKFHYYTAYTYYNIFIVPDDIDIVEYIKSKSIVTTSEIWFYDNKIEGTNLEMSLNYKGYLKEKYLNYFVDNLDKKIISTIKFYTKNNFEIIIDTSRYRKSEITYDNKEKNLILTFLISFFNNDDMLEYFFTKINKKDYPEIEIFKENNQLKLFYKIHFILSIFKNNNYTLKNIKIIFKALSKNNYAKLIDIIDYRLIAEEEGEEDSDDENYDVDKPKNRLHIITQLQEFKELF